MTKEINMSMTLSLAPLVSRIAGILILIVPRLLNYAVEIFDHCRLDRAFGGGDFHIRQ